MPEVHTETEWLHYPVTSWVTWSLSRGASAGQRDQQATSTSAFSPTTIVARTARGGSGIVCRGALVHVRCWSISKCNGLCQRQRLPLVPARGIQAAPQHGMGAGVGGKDSLIRL